MGGWQTDGWEEGWLVCMACSCYCVRIEQLSLPLQWPLFVPCRRWECGCVCGRTCGGAVARGSCWRPQAAAIKLLVRHYSLTLGSVQL